MKRKRGSKKGKSKKQPLQSLDAATMAEDSPDNDEESEDTSGSEEENGNAEEESKPVPPVTLEVPPERRENVRPEGLIQRPPPTAVYGRVKVKLKTALKPPPPPPPSLEMAPQLVASGQLQSDAGKRSEEVINVVDDKKEDGEVVVGIDDHKVEDSTKQTGVIKIVSSKSSSSPGVKESNGTGSSQNLSPSGGEESGGSLLLPEEKKMEEHELRVPPREVKYNKQELEASLEVIKKIMKMDAAEPFNVPVDPIGLGIPDYFDVIDTPMDFGSIRNNLEGGIKYVDSEGVYKDVQFIWDNCYKYNNKGDYIVDLMKRVKKNFMKYWMAAGLYTEQTKKTAGGESSPVDESATSGYGKKLKKGKGVKRHKDDCLCAICIMKRRRREREAREAQLALEAGGQIASPCIKLPKIGLHENYKFEIARNGSPVEENSSYMDTSPDGEAEVEMEDGEMRPDASMPQYNNEQRSEVDRSELHDKSDRSGDISEKSVQSDKGDIELYSRREAKVQDESGSKIQIEAQKQPSIQLEAQTAGYIQQRHEMLELEKKRQKQRMLETFHDLENPMLLGLCGMLFPNNVQSVWNGANSLIRRQRSCHIGDIHEAVASFMNPPCETASSRK